MPRNYGKINHRFWTGETGRLMRAMPLDVRAVATYLMTCGSSNMIGLYYIPLTLIAHEIGSGMTIEGASKALRSLAELGFAFYDEVAELVFVPHMAREQIGESLSLGDRQRLGVLALLKEHEKSRFCADFVELYCTDYHLEELRDKKAPTKGPASPLEAPSKSGEQESREQRAEGGIPPRAHVDGERPARPTGHDLVVLFGQIRSEVFPKTLPWSTARDAKGDAAAFAQLLNPDDVVDVRPTMRLALEHIRDGMKGWTNPRLASDPSFAFGAWKSGFHGLREELQKRSPPAPGSLAARSPPKPVLPEWKPKGDYAAEAAADRAKSDGGAKDEPASGDLDETKRDLANHVTPSTAA